jgi:hypothetical protein
MLGVQGKAEQAKNPIFAKRTVCTGGAKRSRVFSAFYLRLHIYVAESHFSWTHRRFD